MEDRDFHPLLQLALDVETFGCFDVFQVDAAERGLERGNHVDQFIRVVFCQLDVENINAGKLLEQTTLTFHDRLRCQGTNVTKPENRCTVSHHTDQIATRCQRIRFIRIGFNLFAGVSHPRRVGERQITLVS